MAAREDETIAVRSYADVYDFDGGARLYSFGRFQLTDVFPGGVPYRAIAYTLAALGVSLLVGVLPLIGTLWTTLPTVPRLVIVPLLLGVAAMMFEPDGRLLHRAAGDWLRFHLRPRSRLGGRAVPAPGEPVLLPEELAVVPDASWPELVRGRVRGPARVRFTAPVVVSGGSRRRRVRTARAGEAGVASVAVEARRALEVRP